MKSLVAVAKYALIHTHGHNIFISLFLLTISICLNLNNYSQFLVFINVQFLFYFAEFNL